MARPTKEGIWNPTMIITQNQIDELCRTAFEASTADEIEIRIEAGGRGDLRFGCNTPTNASATDFVDIGITCATDRREATATTTGLDLEAVRETVRRACSLALLAPQSPEYVAQLGPQRYVDVDGWDDVSAEVAPEVRTEIAAQTIDAARSQNLVSAGYLENAARITVLANSSGLRASQRATNSSFSVTARSASGASGWAASESFRAGALDSSAVTRAAITKALASEAPIEMAPGAYETVLEPSATADLMAWLVYRYMDRREADEGRSYFGLPGQHLGDSPFPDNVVLRSDPAHPLLPTRKWGEGGLPLKAMDWIDHGRIANLHVSRYWAQRSGIEPLGGPGAIVMDGTNAGLDELVAGVKYGLLVSALHYIREVDPRTMLLTGLTRDGLFLIENGRVTRPVVNFRWNESPAVLLQNAQGIGKPSLAVGKCTGIVGILPPLHARAFHFSSVAPST